MLYRYDGPSYGLYVDTKRREALFCCSTLCEKASVVVLPRAFNAIFMHATSHHLQLILGQLSCSLMIGIICLVRLYLIGLMLLVLLSTGRTFIRLYIHQILFI
jgi:hypothetical protein